jgi:hypothetical protein
MSSFMRDCQNQEKNAAKCYAWYVSMRTTNREIS